MIDERYARFRGTFGVRIGLMSCDHGEPSVGDKKSWQTAFVSWCFSSVTAVLHFSLLGLLPLVARTVRATDLLARVSPSVSMRKGRSRSAERPS